MEAFFGRRRPGFLLEQFTEAKDMAQRRAQLVGAGITEGLQFRVGRLQFRRAFDDVLFEAFVEPADFILRALALGDVADVALDHVFVARFIHVADKFHGDVPAIARFQRQIFIADIAVFLQTFQHDFVRFNVFERT